MLKRILTLAAGAALGVAVSAVALRMAAAWGFLPNRDLNRSADYVRDVIKLVNENYVDANEVGYDRLAREAIHGMAESLDPHSEFLEAKDFSDFEDDLNGDFGGIGVQVEMRKGHVVVIAPIAGTPGERAGILRGDEIVSVDGHALNTTGPMDEAIKHLRGKPNTKVVVGIKRPGKAKVIEMTLVREVIKVDSVRDVHLIDEHIGYIQLVDFSAHTGEQFSNALAALLKQGADSLIIDMRNNPGGLLDAAVQVAEPFFRKDELVVYTKGRKPEDREDYRAELDGDPVQLPIAVIINAGTASAAEVVTGALKDTKRAVVVGERSFGKGSVQTIFDLRNGDGMRLTTAKYYTPSGVSIHEKGIAPQVEVIMSPEEDNKLRLQRARNDMTNPAEFKERFGFTPIVDRQLQAAVDVLQGVTLLDARNQTAGGSSAP
jgi:carboxyl-terminal processing protease